MGGLTEGYAVEQQTNHDYLPDPYNTQGAPC